LGASTQLGHATNTNRQRARSAGDHPPAKAPPARSMARKRAGRARLFHRRPGGWPRL